MEVSRVVDAVRHVRDRSPSAEMFGGDDEELEQLAVLAWRAGEVPAIVLDVARRPDWARWLRVALRANQFLVAGVAVDLAALQTASNQRDLPRALAAALNLMLEYECLPELDPDQRAELFVRHSLTTVGQLRGSRPQRIVNLCALPGGGETQLFRAHVARRMYDRGVARWTRGVDAVRTFQLFNALWVLPCFGLVVASQSGAACWVGYGGVCVGTLNHFGSIAYSYRLVWKFSRNADVAPRFDGGLAFQFLIHLSVLLVVVAGFVGATAIV